MLNISELVIFIEAAKCGNFSQTGKKIGLSQPGISLIIKRLEDHLSVKLFQQQGRSMHLTEAGRVLEPLSKELISLTCSIEEKMKAIQDTVLGDVTIGCSMTLGKSLLTRVMAAFLNQYPSVHMNITCLKKAGQLDQLSAGVVTFGIVSKKIAGCNLDYKKLFVDEVILIVPRHHPQAESPPIHLDDLLREPIILQRRPAGTRDMFFDELRKRNIDQESLNVVLELDSAEEIIIAVEEGIGNAFVSRLTAMHGLKSGRIAEIQVDGMDLERTIYMVRNRAHVLT